MRVEKGFVTGRVQVPNCTAKLVFYQVVLVWLSMLMPRYQWKQIAPAYLKYCPLLSTYMA